MSFLALIIKNLVRQPVRAGLTMFGIAIGITTVVALGVVTEGIKESVGQILRVGGADFIVAQEGTADLTFSNVSEEEWALVDDLPMSSGRLGRCSPSNALAAIPSSRYSGFGPTPSKLARRCSSKGGCWPETLPMRSCLGPRQLLIWMRGWAM